jgi:hypothetical protein
VIDHFYNFWFRRAPNKDEQAKCEELIRSKRIHASEMLEYIYADLTITQIAEVAGDPKDLNVTVANLGSISTSAKTFLGLEFCKGAKCIRDIDAKPALFEVPPIAPKKSIVVKVTSTNVLQQSISQRAYFLIVSTDKNYEPKEQAGNNTRCVPGIAIGKDKVIDQKPNPQFPKNQPPSTPAPPTPKKP